MTKRRTEAATPRESTGSRRGPGPRRPGEPSAGPGSRPDEAHDSCVLEAGSCQQRRFQEGIDDEQKTRALVRPRNHRQRALGDSQDLEPRGLGVDPDLVWKVDGPAVALEAQAQPVAPVGNDAARIVLAVPEEHEAAARLPSSFGERPHVVPSVAHDGGVDGVSLPEPDGKTRPLAPARADGREHDVELRPRDGRPVELEGLGQRKRGGRPRQEREHEHRDGEARQASAILCLASAPKWPKQRFRHPQSYGGSGRLAVRFLGLGLGVPFRARIAREEAKSHLA